MKKIWIVSAAAAAVIMTGCGSSNNDKSAGGLDLPDGKTMIFFDNVSSKQYMYNTDTDKYEDMNIEGKNYDMRGKNGKLVVWNHKTSAGMDQKIVMLDDAFHINEGNLTHTDFHYLGHFHTEDDKQVFAAHSNSEFDPAVASAKKKGALKAFNKYLIEQEEIKQEIAEALPSGEELCNYFVFDHEEHGDHNATEEEAIPHIALSKSGKVYIFEEKEDGLVSSQAVFGLDGVTSCEEDKSSIIKNDDHGVLIFSAQSQKLYLVDSHGDDFHQHSSWTASKFLPTGFTPTGLAGIGEGEHKHENND
ncbi:MAG TPA: hypothetical protein EYH42_10010 [Sulfurovum sp.]|nr:hypothetical protein [Sulfurovum sp.]